MAEVADVDVMSRLQFDQPAAVSLGDTSQCFDRFVPILVRRQGVDPCQVRVGFVGEIFDVDGVRQFDLRLRLKGKLARDGRAATSSVSSWMPIRAMYRLLAIGLRNVLRVSIFRLSCPTQYRRATCGGKGVKHPCRPFRGEPRRPPQLIRTRPNLLFFKGLPRRSTAGWIFDLRRMF